MADNVVQVISLKDLREKVEKAQTGDYYKADIGVNPVEYKIEEPAPMRPSPFPDSDADEVGILVRKTGEPEKECVWWRPVSSPMVLEFLVNYKGDWTPVEIIRVGTTKKDTRYDLKWP